MKTGCYGSQVKQAPDSSSVISANLRTGSTASGRKQVTGAMPWKVMPASQFRPSLCLLATIIWASLFCSTLPAMPAWPWNHKKHKSFLFSVASVRFSFTRTTKQTTVERFGLSSASVSRHRRLHQHETDDWKRRVAKAPVSDVWLLPVPGIQVRTSREIRGRADSDVSWPSLLRRKSADRENCFLLVI